MALLSLNELPFPYRFHFSELIDMLQDKVNRDQHTQNSALLEELSRYPEFRTGFSSPQAILLRKDLLSELLETMFPKMLTSSEIKAVTLPYWELVFNETDRFKNILTAAGPDFRLRIRDFNAHQGYILCCCLVLNKFYQTGIDFSKPLFLDIPAADGSMRHYRVLYNADFLHITPTGKFPELKASEIENLLDHYNDLPLWMDKFPPGSWILEGFVLMSLFDATIENAVSDLNKSLLKDNRTSVNDLLLPAFQAVFKSQDLQIGILFYDHDEHQFTLSRISRPVYSFLYNESHGRQDARWKEFYGQVKSQEIISIADLDIFISRHPDSFVGERLHKQGFKSAIIAGLFKQGMILAVIEIVSEKNDLHSVNAQRLDLLLPTIKELLDKLINDYDTQLRAVIQEHYTLIHPSVAWKFRQNAHSILVQGQSIKYDRPENIVFEEVYPLYAQVDIKGSSIKRNQCILADMNIQLRALKNMLSDLVHLVDLDADIARAAEWLKVLDSGFIAGADQEVQGFIEEIFYSKLSSVSDLQGQKKIDAYIKATQPKTGQFHKNRRMYENTIQIINSLLVDWIDLRQESAQAIYPHYFERFKTDGVEHNIYIGSNIARRALTAEELSQVRLWQLRLVCELYQKYIFYRPSLAISFDLTTLVLVYHNPINISFRTDEKRFDVDGAYNARYEMVKKRIDKAVIKGTDVRIAQPGKLAVVYSTGLEKKQYLEYIELLRTEGLVTGQLKDYQVEDLQGIQGLKVLIIKIGKGPVDPWNLFLDAENES